MWGTRAGVQVSKREFHTHIHLDYFRVKFYLINKKKVPIYMIILKRWTYLAQMRLPGLNPTFIYRHVAW